MTDVARPTPAQLRALEEIGRGKVWRVIVPYGVSYWSGVHDARGDVLTRCVDRRWAVVGRSRPLGKGSRVALVDLTAAGRELLEGRDA